MSKNRTVQPGDLAETIEDILTEYSDEVIRDMPTTVQQVAKNAVKALKSEAAGLFGGTKYKGSFKSKKTTSTADQTTYTIYSTQYRVAHLLEKGHTIKNQTGLVYGVTAARPHWATVEESSGTELETELTKKIKGEV